MYFLASQLSKGQPLKKIFNSFHIHFFHQFSLPFSLTTSLPCPTFSVSILKDRWQISTLNRLNISTVLRIRIRIQSDPVFLGHQDPNPDPGKYRIRENTGSGCLDLVRNAIKKN